MIYTAGDTRLNNLVRKLDQASKAYYNGNPILSDDDFDKLSAYVGYDRVGANAGDNVFPHFVPMRSLETRFEKKSYDQHTVSSPKLDGAAVSLFYFGGKLQRGLTRGDGTKGQDVTKKVMHLVPTDIGFTDPIQITGEVVALKTIKNSRNYASGALNLNSVEDFLSRNLTFIAYGSSYKFTKTWLDDMCELGYLCFNTVISQSWTEFPHDGVVYRVNNHIAFEDMGYTSHHPRGAYAFKIAAAGQITTLLDVVWQVGKSGTVAPVAILDQIEIGGAMVSRATLHNIEYIRQLNLKIGSMVEVIRTGEIIPRVVRVVDI